MADEKAKVGEQNKTEEVASAVSLTEVSQSGFNERAWNDPPPLLLNTAAVQAALQANKELSPRAKLGGRVAYPLTSVTPAPSIVLNPNAPPPTMGFINPAGSSPRDASPRDEGAPPPPSS